MERFFVWLDNLEPKWVSYVCWITFIAATVCIVLMTAAYIMFNDMYYILAIIAVPVVLYAWYIAIFKQE